LWDDVKGMHAGESGPRGRRARSIAVVSAKVAKASESRALHAASVLE